MIENELYILLGSNLGNSKAMFIAAKTSIENQIGKIINQSSIYETAAWGITDQPNFLNQVLQIETKLKPTKVLKCILQIEIEMGRKREQKWGSRLIDIDILYFGNEVIRKIDLIVPHPFLHERRFTLEPLTEIAPYFLHPIFQATNFELLERCEDESNVILMDY